MPLLASICDLKPREHVTASLQQLHWVLSAVQTEHDYVHRPRGGATVLKVGGGQFCEQSEQKNVLTPRPPLFGQWGDKILLR